MKPPERVEPSDLRSDALPPNYGTLRRSPPPTASQMRPHGTPWDNALLKRLEYASRSIAHKSLPVSHLRTHLASPSPPTLCFLATIQRR